MPSRPLDGLSRGSQIEARDADQRVGAEGGRDGVATGAHGEQIAVVDVRRAARERGRGAGAEVGVAGEQRARGVEHCRGAQVDRQRREPVQRALRREPGAAHACTRGAAVGSGRDNARVTFTRIAWLVTVLACIVTGVALLLSGYVGYAAVFGAVGACAAINLR
jgi:hypothetical protein